MNAPVEVTAFGEHAEWTGVRDDDRAAWLKQRKTIVTASDVAAILGQDPRRDAVQVYAEKVTAKIDDTRLTMKDPRFWGKALEQPIAEIAARELGWELRRGGYLLRSRKHPQIGCTLDAEVIRDKAEGWVPYEGKMTTLHHDWDEDSGNLPTRVLVQAQAQLLVTGAPANLVFALLRGAESCLVPIEPYLALHAIIVEETERFIELVQRGEPPEPTAISRDGISMLYPRDNGSCVDLPEEASAWTADIQELQAQAKVIEKRIDELKNRLRLAIGEATYGRLPNSVEKTHFWKLGLEARPEHMVSASETRVLRSVKNGPKTNFAPTPALPEAPPTITPEKEDAAVLRFSTKRRRGSR